MNVEALIVIGSFAAILGAALFLGARWWLRHTPHAQYRSTVPTLTPASLVLSSAIVVCVLGGFSIQYIAPDSAFGTFVSQPIGRLGYVIVLALLFFLIERWLRSRGIKFLKDGQDRERR